jgi:hypothetical protein
MKTFSSLISLQRISLIPGWILGLTMGLTSGCGHHGVNGDSDGPINHTQVVAKYWATQVKDSGDAFDLNFNIRNDSRDKGLLIPIKDLSCQRGDIPGILRVTSLSKGERALTLKPSEVKAFAMSCKLSAKTSGDYGISIAHIYENLKLDGKTSGRTLAENLKWRQIDK